MVVRPFLAHRLPHGQLALYPQVTSTCVYDLNKKGGKILKIQLNNLKRLITLIFGKFFKSWCVAMHKSFSRIIFTHTWLWRRNSKFWSLQDDNSEIILTFFYWRDRQFSAFKIVFITVVSDGLKTKLKIIINKSEEHSTLIGGY